MKGPLQAIWGYAVTIPVVLITMALGERLQFMRDLDAAITASRQTYLNLMIALLVVGWGGFFAAIIYGAATRTPSRRLGQPVPEDDAAKDSDAVANGNEADTGGSFSIEVSFREIKRAWREHRWRDNRVWRLTFFMCFAAACAFIGMFGLFFVLGPGGIRLLTAAAVLYAAARTVQGFIIN